MSVPIRLSPTNKYGARRQWSDLCARFFASGAERRRGEQLWMMQAAGQIQALEFQPRYPLVVWPLTGTCEPGGATVIGHYTADAKYWDCRTKREVVEDVKSTATRTTAYRLRRKLMKAIYGIDVVEVEA